MVSVAIIAPDQGDHHPARIAIGAYKASPIADGPMTFCGSGRGQINRQQLPCGRLLP